MVEYIRHSPKWTKFSASTFHLSFQNTVTGGHSLKPHVVRQFRYCPLFANARTVFYRTIHGRIPTQEFIHKYNRAVSTTCAYCHLHQDTIYHFIVECPKK
ncbi:uncharacterized protein BX663DRAFT_497744 [Cokeromyces recurvatus]|uniref:uncharacterized protein n=1 Tax=Cokeromyces recurvatus TaxID=90255 RepID=UPI002220F6FF|nr:uncharacterized protein BX663DRAFT_497744 [Cokeromyces recurvatus]KAI7905824.1 hypothetical protein BX663DRAFT_497744 [Cokeromyces recurvatus]